KYQAYADHMEREYKSGSLTGYDHFPFADFINAKRIVRHNLIAKIARENQYQIPCYAGYHFKRIWFGAEAERSRRFIRESKCFCTYECFLTINILFNPRMMPAVLKEWSSLKMRKLWRRLTGQQPAPRATLATCGANGKVAAQA